MNGNTGHLGMVVAGTVSEYRNVGASGPTPALRNLKLPGADGRGVCAGWREPQRRVAQVGTGKTPGDQTGDPGRPDRAWDRLVTAVDWVARLRAAHTAGRLPSSPNCAASARSWSTKPATSDSSRTPPTCSSLSGRQGRRHSASLSRSQSWNSPMWCSLGTSTPPSR